MSGLFENEEKDIVLNQLKTDLISRFYPFTNEEVLDYKSVINFSRDHLMENESIQWTSDLLEKVSDLIDWTALWKINHMTFDLNFFRKFESKIDFSSIRFSRNIKWSDELIDEYGERLDLNRALFTNKHLLTIENLRRFRNVLDWSKVSKLIQLDFTEPVFIEFFDQWDWKSLSSNENLSFTFEFVRDYSNLLDFDLLSKNPKCIDLIYRYPTSSRWNWEKVVLNPAFNYDESTFSFVFGHYKRQYLKNNNDQLGIENQALSSFLTTLFSNHSTDLNFFLQDEFIQHLPWDKICRNSSIQMSLEFIEANKVKINFKEPQFIRNHQFVLTEQFIKENITLFDTSSSSFYFLPLSTDFVQNNLERINWNNLSFAEQLNWSWEFISMYYERFNFFKLSKNRAIYDRIFGFGEDNFIVLNHFNNQNKRLIN